MSSAPRARRSACASSSAAARRASPRPTCPTRRWRRWSSARRRWRARRPRTLMPASRPRTGCCAAPGPDVDGDDGADPAPAELKARALGDRGCGARASPASPTAKGAGVERRPHRWSRSPPATASAAAIRPAAIRRSASVIAGERRRRCSATMPSHSVRHYRRSRRARGDRPAAPASARSRGSTRPSCRAGRCRWCSIRASATACSAI